LNNWKFLNTDEHPDRKFSLFGRMLLTDERPDIMLSRPDGSLESDFSELESAQNLS
jgi:hypothetical protein